MIKAIFFDFDGTLVDSISGLFQAYLKLLECYGHKGSEEEFEHLNGPSFSEIVDILKKRYRIPEGHQQIFDQYMFLIAKYYQESKPMYYAQEILEKLSGLQLDLHLVTSNESKNVLPLLKELSWHHFFQTQTFGDDIVNSKPAPDIYLRALRETQLSHSEVIVIEDSINGVRAAKSAKLEVIQVHAGPGVSLKDALDQVVSRIEAG